MRHQLSRERHSCIDFERAQCRDIRAARIGKAVYALLRDPQLHRQSQICSQGQDSVQVQDTQPGGVPFLHRESLQVAPILEFTVDR